MNCLSSLKNTFSLPNVNREYGERGNFELQVFEDVKATYYGSLSDKKFLLNSSYLSIYTERPQSEVEREKKFAEDSEVIRTDIDIAFVLTSRFYENYQHFLIEGLVLIYITSKYFKLDCPVVVPDKPHIRDVVSTCFPELEFIFLDFSQGISCQRAIIPTPIVRNLCDFSPYTFESLRFLVANISKLARENDSPNSEVDNKKLFFYRASNKENSGAGRYIANESELIDCLTEFDYKTDNVDGCDFIEKYSKLCDVEFMVTPIGANLLNVLLSSKLKELIVISHHFAFGEHGRTWFHKLLTSVIGDGLKVNFFDEVEPLKEEFKEVVNSPYIVNCELLKQQMQR